MTEPFNFFRFLVYKCPLSVLVSEGHFSALRGSNELA